MSFIDHFFTQLDTLAHRPLITEVRNSRLIPWTGKALREDVNRGRGTLRAHGVKAGDRVVLLAPNSGRWLAADLALLAEGTIIVPMYARQDPEELVAMMHDCTPSLVVCADAALAEGVTTHWADAPVVTFDTFFAGDAINEPHVKRDDDDVVTIIYTSGTSGEPKGVMLTQQGIDFILTRVSGAIEGLVGDKGAGERVFHYLPFCFAGSRIVLWMCLNRGRNIMISTDLNDLINEVKVAAPHYFLNVPRLLDRIRLGVTQRIRTQHPVIQWIYKRGIQAHRAIFENQASMIDEAFYALSRWLIFNKVRNQIGPNLEGLLCGSAPLSEDTQLWFEALGIPVLQIYGLTETTAIVTMDIPGDVTPGRVGVTIDGVETKIGDGDELLVKGPNIFAGYWKREEKTAESFTEDGWFRTGDQVNIDARGRWQIVGRVKNILVLSTGHNVAPEPIEQALVEHIDDAEQAVVFGHGHPFVTAVFTGTVTREQAQQGVNEVNATLPHYRRIRDFFISDELLTPENGLLTANMKLRRKVITAHFKDALATMYASKGEG